jgi:replication-associated recombination protein RarA
MTMNNLKANDNEQVGGGPAAASAKPKTKDDWQITKRGYNFYEVLSALQKAIRRGDARLACYWAAELYESGFGPHVWNRLLIISAEDCWGTVTQHVEALRQEFKALEAADKHINKNKDGSAFGNFFWPISAV